MQPAARSDGGGRSWAPTEMCAVTIGFAALCLIDRSPGGGGNNEFQVPVFAPLCLWGLYGFASYKPQAEGALVSQADAAFQRSRVYRLPWQRARERIRPLRCFLCVAEIFARHISLLHFVGASACLSNASAYHAPIACAEASGISLRSGFAQPLSPQ